MKLGVFFIYIYIHIVNDHRYFNQPNIHKLLVRLVVLSLASHHPVRKTFIPYPVTPFLYLTSNLLKFDLHATCSAFILD